MLVPTAEEEEQLQHLLMLTHEIEAHRIKAKQAVDDDPELDEESSYDFEDNKVKIQEEKDWLLSARFSEEESVSNGITESAKTLADKEPDDPNAFQLRYKVYKRINKNTFLQINSGPEENKIVSGEVEIPAEIQALAKPRSARRPKSPDLPLAITPIPVSFILIISWNSTETPHTTTSCGKLVGMKESTTACTLKNNSGELLSSRMLTSPHGETLMLASSSNQEHCSTEREVAVLTMMTSSWT